MRTVRWTVVWGLVLACGWLTGCSKTDETPVSSGAAVPAATSVAEGKIAEPDQRGLDPSRYDHVD